MDWPALQPTTQPALPASSVGASFRGCPSGQRAAATRAFTATQHPAAERSPPDQPGAAELAKQFCDRHASLCRRTHGSRSHRCSRGLVSRGSETLTQSAHRTAHAPSYLRKQGLTERPRKQSNSLHRPSPAPSASVWCHHCSRREARRSVSILPTPQHHTCYRSAAPRLFGRAGTEHLRSRAPPRAPPTRNGGSRSAASPGPTTSSGPTSPGFECQWGRRARPVPRACTRSHGRDR